MKALVVGGTSGLGLEIGRRLRGYHYDEIVITGRTDPEQEGLTFFSLSLNSWQGFSDPMRRLADDHIFDTIIYNPGFYQEGLISDLTDQQIIDIVNVGFLAAAMLMQRILKRQNKLGGFVAITSTSQWIPRKLEPVYTGVKAALGMFANSLSLDERIVRTLVAAPSGMKTNFWDGTGKDTQSMLDPQWVAEQVCDQLFANENFRYRYFRILRDPPRIEIVETRE